MCIGGQDSLAPSNPQEECARVTPAPLTLASSTQDKGAPPPGGGRTNSSGRGGAASPAPSPSDAAGPLHPRFAPQRLLLRCCAPAPQRDSSPKPSTCPFPVDGFCHPGTLISRSRPGRRALAPSPPADLREPRAHVGGRRCEIPPKQRARGQVSGLLHQVAASPGAGGLGERQGPLSPAEMRWGCPGAPLWLQFRGPETAKLPEGGGRHPHWCAIQELPL